MHKRIAFSGVLVCALAFAAACEKQDEYNDNETAQPAEMPAPAPTTQPAEGGPAAPQTTQLEAKNNSGITGDVTATHTASDVTVQISLNGLKDGQAYPAHIHQGTCASDGPVVVELDSITASGTTGQSTTTVEAAKLSANQSYFVQAHDPTGAPVACSDLPGHTTS